MIRRRPFSHTGHSSISGFHPVVRGLLCCILPLAGCAGGGSGDVMKDSVQTFTEGRQEIDRAVRAPFQTKTPIELQQGTGTLGAAAKPVDLTKLTPAIERHAEGRHQKAGTFIATGANLTPDGKLRALVLFTSENWCQPQGCELAIFEQGAFGWKSVATVSRVRAPVLVSANVTAGWHDLWVSTGKQATGKDAKSFVQNVLLKYGPNGYPGTTTFAISSTKGSPEGQALIQSADLTVPDKARFATGGRDPESTKKKKSELLSTVQAGKAADQPAAK